MKAMQRKPLGIAPQQCAAEVRGSLDYAAPFEQMQAVNEIMRCYFDAADWLTARDNRQPELYRVGS